MNYDAVVKRLFGRTPVTTFVTEAARDDLSRAAVEAGAAVLADFGDAPRAVARLADNRFAAIGETHAALLGGDTCVAAIGETEQEKDPPASVRELTPVEKKNAREHVKRGRKAFRFGRFKPGMAVTWNGERWIVYDARARGGSRFTLMLVSPDYEKLADEVQPSELGESEANEAALGGSWFARLKQQLRAAVDQASGALDQLRGDHAGASSIRQAVMAARRAQTAIEKQDKRMAMSAIPLVLTAIDSTYIEPQLRSSLVGALGRLRSIADDQTETIVRPADESQSFTPAHLEQLRTQFAQVKTVDPSSPTYDRMIKLLDGMSQHQLKQVAGANIKFLSKLALNRVKKTEAVSPAWGRYASLLGESFSVIDRYRALGIPRPNPATMCQGPCDGTGVAPVRSDEQDQELRRRWGVAEQMSPAEDGWHFVPCPDCEGSRLREAGDDEIGRVQRDLEYARADARDPDLNAKAKAKLQAKVKALDAKFSQLLASRKAAASTGGGEGEGKWRTTPSGHKIFIDGDGKVTKGNPHVLKAGSGSDEKGDSSTKSDVPAGWHEANGMKEHPVPKKGKPIGWKATPDSPPIVGYASKGKQIFALVKGSDGKIGTLTAGRVKESIGEDRAVVRVMSLPAGLPARNAVSVLAQEHGSRALDGDGYVFSSRAQVKAFKQAVRAKFPSASFGEVWGESLAEMRMEAGLSYEGHSVLVMRDKTNFAFIVDGELVQDGFSSRAAALKAAKKHVDEMPVMAEAKAKHAYAVGDRVEVHGEGKGKIVRVRRDSANAYEVSFDKGGTKVVWDNPDGAAAVGYRKITRVAEARANVAGWSITVGADRASVRSPDGDFYTADVGQDGAVEVLDSDDEPARVPGAVVRAIQRMLLVASESIVEAKVPHWRDLVSELLDKAEDITRETEVHLRVSPKTWDLLVGPQKGEPVQRGVYWGEGTIDPGMTRDDAKELAVDMIDQVRGMRQQDEGVYNANDPTPFDPPEVVKAKLAARDAEQAQKKREAEAARAPAEKLAATLTADERKVLAVTTGYIPAARRKQSGLSQDAYDAAVAGLKAKKLMTSQGALTPATRELMRALDMRVRRELFGEAELPKRDQDAISKMAPGAIKQAQIDKARRDAHYAKPTTAVAADWDQFEGVLVMRRPGSQFVAVPITGKKSSKLFDVIRVEGKREHVAQVKSSEVGAYLASLDRADESVDEAAFKPGDRVRVNLPKVETPDERDAHGKTGVVTGYATIDRKKQIRVTLDGGGPESNLIFRAGWLRLVKSNEESAEDGPQMTIPWAFHAMNLGEFGQVDEATYYLIRRNDGKFLDGMEWVDEDPGFGFRDMATARKAASDEVIRGKLRKGQFQIVTRDTDDVDEAKLVWSATVPVKAQKKGYVANPTMGQAQLTERCNRCHYAEAVDGPNGKQVKCLMFRFLAASEGHCGEWERRGSPYAKKVAIPREGVEEGYQHVHFEGSKSARAKTVMAGGKTKSVQGRTFDGVLLVHPTGNYQWGVTHIPTGFGLVPPPGFSDDREAVKFAKAASALGGWDFTDPQAMPPELPSKMSSLIAAFRPHIRRTGGGSSESVAELLRASRETSDGLPRLVRAWTDDGKVLEKRGDYDWTVSGTIKAGLLGDSMRLRSALESTRSKLEAAGWTIESFNPPA